MATISEDDIFTQVVRFNVAEGKQMALIEAIAGEVERWVRHQPGFVSVSLHASDNGRHVMNYAQWKDQAAFEAFSKAPETKALQEAIKAVDPSIRPHGFHCKVVRSISR